MRNNFFVKKLDNWGWANELNCELGFYLLQTKVWGVARNRGGDGNSSEKFQRNRRKDVGIEEKMSDKHVKGKSRSVRTDRFLPLKMAIDRT